MSDHSPERGNGPISRTGLVARLALALLLCATAMAKLWSPDTESLLGPWLARMTAVAELVIAAGLLFSSRAPWPTASAILLAIAGAAVAILAKTPCGCTGPIKMSGAAHFQLCMTIGFLACIAAWQRPRQR